MRITKLEAILLRPRGTIDTAIADGSQDGLLVRIHTDDGIIGLGEVDSSPAIAKAIIEAPSSHKLCNGLAALLIGENPLEIGRLWQKMYKGSLYYGRRGAAIHAISGVEIALWDIAGKAAGKPIHALLGGARRDRGQGLCQHPDARQAEGRGARRGDPDEGGIQGGEAGLGAAGPIGRARRGPGGRRAQGGRRRSRSHDRRRQGLAVGARRHRPRAADGGIQPLLDRGALLARRLRANMPRWPRPSARPSPAARRRRRSPISSGWWRRAMSRSSSPM